MAATRTTIGAPGPAGFRADVDALGGAFTPQGDIYENFVDTPGGRRSGGNVLGRWSRRFANGSTVEAQAYYDQQNRSDASPTGGGSAERVRTFDVQIAQVFTIGERHRIERLALGTEHERIGGIDEPLDPRALAGTPHAGDVAARLPERPAEL